MIPRRLKALYAALPAGVRGRVPPRLEALAAGLARRAFGGLSTGPVRRIEAKLLVHSDAAAAELAALAEGRQVPRRQAAAAAWALARWRADHGTGDHGAGDPAAALAALARMRARSPRAHAAARRLLEADCLIRLGRAAEARALLGGNPGPDAALLLVAAQSGPGAQDARRALIARAFAPAGGVGPADPALPLSLDNLAGTLSHDNLAGTPPHDLAGLAPIAKTPR